MAFRKGNHTKPMEKPTNSTKTQKLSLPPCIGGFLVLKSYEIILNTSERTKIRSLFFIRRRDKNGEILYGTIQNL